MVSTEVRDGKSILTMSRERGNAINSQLVADLRDAFRHALHEPSVYGVILTGSNGYFSSGLDLVELSQHDPEEFERFWWNYSALVEELISFQKPYIAAINGHATGSGCVLALCADHRVMADTGNDDQFHIGLNKIAAGLVVPESFGALFANVVGCNRAFSLIMDAALVRARTALSIGLIDDLVPLADLSARAELKMDQWLAFSHDAWRKTKYNLRQPLCEIFAQDFRKLYGETIRTWWSPETRAYLEYFAAAQTGH
jgi:enoyl-CoA hydratase/carnithine racemase